ncbi:pimeloyl-ACP methyl ester carboxylesterase [Sphingobium sp. JAI105]|uniref:alpha/beta hydrolase n=1 Tax=Sphingobium sp. JAI105 TaxID=2787715 RepID=UPI0018C96B0D|nr:alpha/beta hydrolase [Sphingobium sp. JAI105]MBG6118500.1 pimeloyl-ACP methyl ester carboxylesterase [Sphingobium sp. JAI105]
MSVEFQIEVDGGVLAGRRADPSDKARIRGGPLIVAIHGGSYTSKYFDIAGYSLLDRAAAAGCSAVAFDRPGYGGSTLLECEDAILQANAHRLEAGIAELWRRDNGQSSGVFLVGHSMGGAISTLIAASEPSWPLLGLAVSGIALAHPEGVPAFEGEPPEEVYLEVPDEVKIGHMFGPEGTYAADAPKHSAAANHAVIFREIIDINAFPSRASDVYALVRAPVHYRHGEHDVLWSKAEGEVERVAKAFVLSPRVDAALVVGAGHAIDFHHSGQELQQAQIAFAIGCAVLERGAD